MKVDLDRRENLDGFQKLVSTLRTFSISISIGLDVETTGLRYFTINTFLLFCQIMVELKWRSMEGAKIQQIPR